VLSRSLIEYCSQWPITFETGIRLEWNCLPSHGTADYWNGRINPILASLIEELPASGEWSREEQDFSMQIFLRTVDKLYKVKDS
jgi:hypothetical protein